MTKRSNNQRSTRMDNDHTITRVHKLAWTGQHALAIVSATQALAAPKIKPAEQMSLLDLRAESYIALGKLDRAMKDAKAMGKLAKGGASGSGKHTSGTKSPIPKFQFPESPPQEHP